jgi:elongation factor 1-beta
VTTAKGLAAFNGFIGSKSYVEGWSFSPVDTIWFGKFSDIPDAAKYPHAYRWYIHIAALNGVRGLSMAPPPAAAAAPEKKSDDDADDFEVFGDDDAEKKEEQQEEQESRVEKLARLKKDAEERTARKEKQERTLVSIEIKPWDIEEDLMALWKKVTTTVVQDGVKWGENCTLAPVAFGIMKIQCSFTMGVNNSSDIVVEEIQALEDEVQSVEITSMNVL